MWTAKIMFQKSSKRHCYPYLTFHPQRSSKKISIPSHPSQLPIPSPPPQWKTIGNSEGEEVSMAKISKGLEGSGDVQTKNLSVSQGTNISVNIFQKNIAQTFVEKCELLVKKAQLFIENMGNYWQYNCFSRHSKGLQLINLQHWEFLSQKSRSKFLFQSKACNHVLSANRQQ